MPGASSHIILQMGFINRQRGIGYTRGAAYMAAKPPQWGQKIKNKNYCPDVYYRLTILLTQFFGD